MDVFARLKALFGRTPRRAPRRSTGYAAAEISRLTASLAADTEFINVTLRHQLRRLRARSRAECQSNPYARRFAQMVVDNVCGPLPFRLQSKVKFGSGKMDDASNRRIEEQWTAWSRKGACELSGRFSWNAVQRLIVRTLAVDGEVLIRRFRGPEYGRHGFQIQIVDVDRLDDQKNEALPGGGAIHMGVEVDAQNRPVAYHILRRKPSSWNLGGYSRESDRVMADDVLHLFIPEFAEQVRGVPWMYAALLNLVHTGAFAEAAVIAARLGASAMAFIEAPDGGEALANAAAPGPDGTGNVAVQQDPQLQAEPGAMPVLPAGYKFADSWNPKYPDAAIEPFIKACLRGIAVGVNVAYHNLSGDMEGVNYSSARIAELDERDGWMTLQNFIIEHLHDDLYADWLRMSVLVGALPFNPAQMDKYRAVQWMARRWGWVDPEKEINAAKTAIAERLRSRTQVVADAGGDFEDTLDEIAGEEAMAAQKKVALPNNAPVPPEPPAEPAASGKALEAAVRTLRDAMASGPAAPVVVTPNVSVHVAQPEVHFKSDVQVPPAAAPVVTVLPAERQEAPVVNVQVEAPQVSVPVTVQPADVAVNIDGPIDMNIKSMPDRLSTSETQRNGSGQIVKVTQTETDA